MSEVATWENGRIRRNEETSVSLGSHCLQVTPWNLPLYALYWTHKHSSFSKVNTCIFWHKLLDTRNLQWLRGRILLKQVCWLLNKLKDAGGTSDPSLTYLIFSYPDSFKVGQMGLLLLWEMKLCTKCIILRELGTKKGWYVFHKKMVWKSE